VKNARYLQLAARLLDLQSELAASSTDADCDFQKSIHMSLNQVVEGKLPLCTTCGIVV